MIGYKAFDENLQCRGFQFEVGKTYETGKTKEELKLCTDTVIHFCRELNKIENTSNYVISKSRVCEVIAEGDIVTDGNKYGTNKLFILREIPRGELDKYNHFNSGNHNSGDYNSGKKKLRPFKDTDELFTEWAKRAGKLPIAPIDMPAIYLKSKNSNVSALISFYGSTTVCFDDITYTMQNILDNYTFNDGSPCGIEEE